MAEVSTNLLISFSICETNNCKILKLSDATGAETSGGWGDPNPEATNVTSVSIDILMPNDELFTIDSSIYPTLLDYFPDPSGLLEFPIDMTYLGGVTGDKFPDGLYEITIVIHGTFGANTYTEVVRQKSLLTCQITCCKDKLFHDAAETTDCTDCKKEKLNQALELDSYLKAAKYAAECGKANMAKKLLAKCQWLCSSRNCLNC